MTLVWLTSMPIAQADVKPNSLFGDHAVLQRRKPIALWGTADPDEIIVVRLQSLCANTTADKDGKWIVHLPPLEAGGPYDLTIKGKNRIVFHDVYVGEVWLCSGQSNMVMSVSYAKDSKPDIENSLNPDLHLCTVKETLSQTPIVNAEASWCLANPDTVRNFSAVAYYFGRLLQKTGHIPIGLIFSAYPGTGIKVWMSAESITASHDTVQVDPPANYLEIREAYDRAVDKWRIAMQEARDKGLDEPAKPVLPSDFYANSSAFNAMISPLVPYSVGGVLWYQGESDYEQPERWRHLFAYMIDDWRKRWQDEALPFIYVQVPGNGKRHRQAADVQYSYLDSHWAQLRESQLLARRIPYAYMVCTIDTTSKSVDIDIHPREKKPVGERAADVALACVYKCPVHYSGPLYDSMELIGDKIKLRFRFADTGLIAKDGKLCGFVIAGVDKKFVPAEAKIEGNSVIVWSEKVSTPVAVRYSWESNPDGNLFNKHELPAAPFRTDTWLLHFNKNVHT
jgi:sialate O-acetylesterase